MSENDNQIHAPQEPTRHMVNLEYRCQSGCLVFSCGSIKHHPDCKNYPESQAYIVNRQRQEIKRLQKVIDEAVMVLEVSRKDDGYDNYAVDELITKLKEAQSDE